MGIKDRIENLEKRTGAGQQIVIIVTHEGDCEPSQEKKDQAQEAYIAQYGEQDIMVLHWEGDHFEFHSSRKS
ncbi:hypothetical protein ACFLVE_04245 [Chloroflexota bacterium]